MFSWWKKTGTRQQQKQRNLTARQLYKAIEEQSRLPVFYTTFAVPDTFTGRFEMIALHAGLIIDRLQNEQGDQHDEGIELAQAVFDEMFTTLSISLREMGIGDVGIPKHMKRMMKALKGRSLAYIEGYHHSHEALQQAVLRNVYESTPDVAPQVVEAMMAYVSILIQNLKIQEFATLNAGAVYFPNIEIEARNAA